MAKRAVVQQGEFIGETCVDGTRSRVYAWVADGRLFLHRVLVDNRYDVDSPFTVVTREGLLRLSQGPFEQGYVEDQL